MKRKFYILLMSVFVISASAYSQTRITLAEGDDLIATVEAAAAGDTIAIVPGFHVASYKNVLVQKSLAFISTDKKVKPHVYIKQFDIEGTDLELYFEGINFSTASVDSVAQTEDTTTLVSEDTYFLNLTTNHVSITNLTLKSCVIRNVSRAMLRADRAANTATNILVDDCLIYDQRGGGDYGVFRTKDDIVITNFTIKNSTFYAITNRFIDLESTTGSPIVLIENCTFYRWGGGKTGQYLFDFKNNTSGTLKIQSCILGKTNDNELVTVNGFRMPTSGSMEMANTAMAPDFVITDSAYSVVSWDKTEYNLEDTDPNFADPDNGDFTLPETSDLLQWSPEGTIIGDPRWSPFPPASIKLTKNNMINFYPNPANGYFFVDTEEDAVVRIFSIAGELVKQFENVNKNNILDVSNLTTGIYIIRLNNTAEAGKLVIQ